MVNFVFFLRYSLMHHKNPLEIFPFGALPPSPLENRKIDPNPLFPHGKFDPFRGGGMDFLEPHNIINLTALFSISCRGTIDYALTSLWKVQDSTLAGGGFFSLFFWSFWFAFSLNILFHFLSRLKIYW